MALDQKDGNPAGKEVRFEGAVRRLMVLRLVPFACIASDTHLKKKKKGGKEVSGAFSTIFGIRLSPELPTGADAEPQVLGRERREAITHQRHTLKRDLDQHRISFSRRYPNGGGRP